MSEREGAAESGALIGLPRRPRSAIRLLLVVALTVGSVLTAVLWWAGAREQDRLEATQREWLQRTAQLGEVLLRNRLERGDTVLRAISSSRAVQDALAARNAGALNAAISALQDEFAGTLVVIDGLDGKPLAASNTLALLSFGVGNPTIDRDVKRELSVTAGDLVVRVEQPIEVQRTIVGRLRGAVLLGRFFVQQLANDLRAPIAVFVDGHAVHHTFPATPETQLDADHRLSLAGERYDVEIRPLNTLGEQVHLLVGAPRSTIEAVQGRSRLLLALVGAGALGLTLVAVGGYLAIGAAQERIVRQRDEAERRSRLTLDRFEALRAVVHDIKAPVSGIQLRSEGLLESFPEPPVAAALGQIADTCERLNLYLANVLTAAESEDAPLRIGDEVILVPGLLHELAERVEPLALRHSVQLVVDADPSLPPLRGDGALLERALWNLTANALAITPAGGTVTLFAHRQNHQLALGVEDTGPGFVDFNPAEAFSRERPRVKHGSFKAGSSGLGLFIVAKVAQSHRGRSVAENLPAGGARVAMILPLG